jgi:hypothetical protein
MSSVSTLTDQEFNILINESMSRQSHPLASIDPRARRWSREVKDYGLYVGLFQVKDDACTCLCEASGVHCEWCVGIERGARLHITVTESDKEQVRGLPSPA